MYNMVVYTCMCWLCSRFVENHSNWSWSVTPRERSITNFTIVLTWLRMPRTSLSLTKYQMLASLSKTELEHQPARRHKKSIKIGCMCNLGPWPGKMSVIPLTKHHRIKVQLVWLTISPRRQLYEQNWLTNANVHSSSVSKTGCNLQVSGPPALLDIATPTDTTDFSAVPTRTSEKWRIEISV
jgi:hypothetical protein